MHPLVADMMRALTAAQVAALEWDDESLPPGHAVRALETSLAWATRLTATMGRTRRIQKPA